MAGRKSIVWSPAEFGNLFDAALIVTDHDKVDYAELVDSLDIIVDTRNATRNVLHSRGKIVLA
jgi:UDP-N-acetyl-D-glucosamine dehydrogenase